MSIARTQGCGEKSVMSALRAIGWRLELSCSGRTFDAYTLERMANAKEVTE